MIKEAKDIQGIGAKEFTAAITKARRKKCPAENDVGDATLKAEINHGRWVVNCPCGGAEMADKSFKLFYCLSCMNEWLGGKWARVEFPKNAGNIEKALDKRDVKNQNWKPGETLKQLKEEVPL